MGIPTDQPIDHTPLVAVERERLLDLLRLLEPEDWERPTPCPGWSVLGLVVHLVGDDLSLVSWLRDDHRGTPAPDGLDEAGFVAWLDRLQIEWVHAARRLSPRLAVELLEWLGGLVTDALRHQDPSAVTASVTWASTDPVPVWLDHARELTERWIHRQQLLEALGRPTDLRPDLAGPVLDALRWAYPFRLGAHRRPPGTTVEVRVVDDRLPQRWRLVAEGDGWDFTADGTGRDLGPPGVAAASMSPTLDQAWRLLTNNHRAEQHGAIETDGDPALVETLLATRAIIGEAG